MKDTGRIKEFLKPELQRIIYGENSNSSIDTELRYATTVDKAHVLMLYKQKLIEETTAKKLLTQILELEKNDYNALKNQETPRGIYFLYEDYLRKTTGNSNGGMLQFGRSRNDLKATVLRLRLRKPYMEVIDELLKFTQIMLDKSVQYKKTIMPAYTHYQPAVPITYGHYLAGIAEETLNIIKDFCMMNEINQSPLGAGAVGGTTINIDCDYTAKLLGFTNVIQNSITAVASRKIVLDLLSKLIEVELLISRCCEDYLLWTSSDLQFIYLPDNLVGGSSMMPNKRNAFLFENIRGCCTKALGAYVSAVGAMKGEPFTNSIAVGTEAVTYIWDVFENTINMLLIMENIISDAAPAKDIMLKRAESGFTLATEYANCLTLQYNIDFRDAHKIIGSIVNKSISLDNSLEEQINEWIKSNYNDAKTVPNMDICSIVDRTCYGSGPGIKSFAAANKKYMGDFNKYNTEKERILSNWNESKEILRREIVNVIGDEC